eukprot:6213628-Pleurochrysis_carterae.AAC.2
MESLIYASGKEPFVDKKQLGRFLTKLSNRRNDLNRIDETVPSEVGAGFEYSIRSTSSCSSLGQIERIRQEPNRLILSVIIDEDFERINGTRDQSRRRLIQYPAPRLQLSCAVACAVLCVRACWRWVRSQRPALLSPGSVTRNAGARVVGAGGAVFSAADWKS